MSRTRWLAASAGLLLASSAHADCAESLQGSNVTFRAASFCEAVAGRLGSKPDAKVIRASQRWPKGSPAVGGECVVQATYTTTLEAYVDAACPQLSEHPNYAANKTKKVTLALNTHQAGRMVQDDVIRFEVQPKPGAESVAKLKRKP